MNNNICNYCRGYLIHIFNNNSINLEVGTCNNCNLKQLCNFDHINLSLYTTLENMPDN